MNSACSGARLKERSVCLRHALAMSSATPSRPLLSKKRKWKRLGSSLEKRTILTAISLKAGSKSVTPAIYSPKRSSTARLTSAASSSIFAYSLKMGLTEQPILLQILRDERAAEPSSRMMSIATPHIISFVKRACLGMVSS